MRTPRHKRSPPTTPRPLNSCQDLPEDAEIKSKAETITAQNAWPIRKVKAEAEMKCVDSTKDAATKIKIEGIIAFLTEQGVLVHDAD